MRATSILGVKVPVGAQAIGGELSLPADSRGLVIFAHGSGSSRHSPRNQYVARRLQAHQLATLLIDLLSSEEEERDRLTGELRFDIDLLTERVVGIADWIKQQPKVGAHAIGLFGASTGAAAALMAAAQRPQLIKAVVSRGGRPDLAGPSLPRVVAPTLLIVGAEDHQVLLLNRQAMKQMPGTVSLVVVPGATHLFEEPGALDHVASDAAEWFRKYL
jgi:dienelactone hydrolase